MIPIFRQFIEGHQDAFFDVLEQSATRIAVLELLGPLQGLGHILTPDIDNFCNACGFRTAKVYANTLTFHSANDRKIIWLIAYRGANFNIIPPPAQNDALCVFDVLSRANLMEDIPYYGYPQLPDNHYHCIERLPSGWNYEALKRCSRKGPVPNIDTNYKRIVWYRPMLLWKNEVPVHPMYHRPLTHDEYIALMADMSDRWIERMAELFLSDHWKENDFESMYHHSRKVWLGEATPGKLNKVFDAYWFGTREPFPHIRTLEHYLFERDTNIEIIQPTNLIEQAFAGV